MPMSYEDFAVKARSIWATAEKPEDAAQITDELIAEYKERNDAATSAETEAAELKKINERLQRVNGELLMRTGVKGESDDLKGAEEVKDVDFSVLFGEDGELK